MLKHTFIHAERNGRAIEATKMEPLAERVAAEIPRLAGLTTFVEGC